MDDLIRQCCDSTECSDYGTGACGDELMAFAECGVTAVACAQINQCVGYEDVVKS